MSLSGSAGAGKLRLWPVVAVLQRIVRMVAVLPCHGPLSILFNSDGVETHIGSATSHSLPQH